MVRFLLSLFLSCFIVVSYASVSSAQTAAELFDRGVQLYIQERYQEAANTFERAAELRPEAIQIHSNLGLSLHELGLRATSQQAQEELFTEAEKALRRAVELNSGFFEPYLNLGRVLVDQGRYIAAEAELREAVRLDPNSVNSHNNLGRALSGQGYLAEAEKSYRTAIRLNPTYAEAYSNLGLVLSGQENYIGAANAYREAIELDPTYALTYNNLGYLRQTQGDIEGALELYRQALALEPNLVITQANVAEAERLLSIRNPAFLRPSNSQQSGSLALKSSVVRVVTDTLAGTKHGTGWVIKRKGDRIWVLTNRHVVTESTTGDSQTLAQAQIANISSSIRVDLYSESVSDAPQRLPAQVVEVTDSSQGADLALLAIDGAPENIQPLPVKNGAGATQSDSVTVIGHPITNLPWTLDVGSISNGDNQNMYISQAPFGPGSSGAPILDTQQRVVGMVFRAVDARAAGTSSGFGVAYHMNYIRPILTRWGML